MQDSLGDVSAVRDLEATMWTRFEDAAAKVGCSVDQIQPYFEMALNTCRPTGMRPIPVNGTAVGPIPEMEVLQAEYRIALSELLKCLDAKQLEDTFAQLVRDAL